MKGKRLRKGLERWAWLQRGQGYVRMLDQLLNHFGDLVLGESPRRPGMRGGATQLMNHFRDLGLGVPPRRGKC